MQKIRIASFLFFLLSKNIFAQTYDEINFGEYLHFSNHKYFAKQQLKNFLKKKQQSAYNNHFNSLYILDLIEDIDDEKDFLSVEKIIAQNTALNAKLLEEVAKYYERTKDYNRALKFYNKIQPATSEVNIHKTRLNIMSGDTQAASELLQNIEEKFATEKSYYEAIILFTKDEFDKALEIFKSLKKDQHYEKKVARFIAQCYLQLGKYKDVIDYVKKLEKDDVDFDDKLNVYRIIGDACMYIKKYDDAIKFYDKALTYSVIDDTEQVQSVIANEIPLAESPQRQNINVISLDDIEEIADIESVSSDDEDDKKLEKNETKPEKDETKNDNKKKSSKEKLLKGKEIEIKNVDEEKNSDKEDKDIEESDDVQSNTEQISMYVNIVDRIKLREGIAFYEKGQFDKAQSFWQKISGDDTLAFKQAKYFSGVAALRVEKIDEALQCFTEAKDIAVNNASNEEYNDLQAKITLCCAEINYNEKKFEEAKELIVEFKNSFPQHPLREKIDSLLFKISINEKDYDYIINELEQVEDKTEQQRELLQKALLFKGNDLLNHKDYKEAISVYERSLDEGNNFKFNNYAYLGLGECYTYEKKFSEALSEYRSVDRACVKYPYALLGIAYIQFNTEKYDDAYKNFNALLKNYKSKFDRSTLGDIYNRLGDCLFIKRQYKNALSMYQQNGNEHSLFYQGIIYEMWNDSSRAINFFSKIHDNSIYHEQALLEIGTIQLTLSQFSKSVSTFSKLIDLYPNGTVLNIALLRRATANTNLKNFKQARKDYLFFLESFPNDKNYSSVLSNLLSITKDIKKRQEYIARFKNKIKNLDSFSFNEGKNYFYSQKYDKAVNTLEKFVTENPNNKNYDEACYLLAEAYRIKKNIDKSLGYYNTLAGKAKSSFRLKALIKLSGIYVSRDDHDNAIRCFEKIKAHGTSMRDKYFALNGLMNEYFVAKKFDSAIACANECLKNQDMFVEANLVICKSNFELKNFAKVLQSCQSMMKDKRFFTVQDELLFLKSKVLFEQKKYNDSLNSLFELTKKFSNSKFYEESYVVMAQNYIAQNKITQANKTLDSIIQNSNNEEIKERARQLKVVTK